LIAFRFELLAVSTKLHIPSHFQVPLSSLLDSIGISRISGEALIFSKSETDVRVPVQPRSRTAFVVDQVNELQFLNANTAIEIIDCSVDTTRKALSRIQLQKGIDFIIYKENTRLY
jgi:hypothetical protein